VRQVDRKTVPVPQKLTEIYANQVKFDEAKQAISNGTDIRKGLYRHASVELAIESLYKNICFLCQKGVRGNYDVEHLLPWSKYYADRAYNWNNLHQSCKECNQRKKRQDYKELDPQNKSKVTDILLLDPTTDEVEKLITFDPFSSEASVTKLGIGFPKANTTAHFLNSNAYILAREEHWKAISKILLDEEWLDAYIVLRRAYKNFHQVTLDNTDDTDIKVGSLCYRIAAGYLGITKPYNMYVLRVISENTGGITPYAIKHFAQQHCERTGATLPSLVV
jgi:uncharacterized protein (TIGR02646 family)